MITLGYYTMTNIFVSLFTNKHVAEEIHALKTKFNGQTAKHVAKSEDLTRRMEKTIIYKIGASEIIAHATGRLRIK